MLTFDFFFIFFFAPVITLALLTPKKNKIIEAIFPQGKDQNSPVINTWSILRRSLPGTAPGGMALPPQAQLSPLGPE